MNQFVASGRPASTTPTAIANAAFFGDGITLEAYRADSRIDRTVEDGQAIGALNQAVVATNYQLVGLVAAALKSGYSTLRSMTPAAHLPPKFYVDTYARAVYRLADVLLHEHYSAFDGSGSGDRRYEAMTPSIDTHRREHDYAIADLLGQRRVRLELL